MVAGMRPGSVIVDMAVETGGNVEGSKVGEVVDVNGVKIIGLGNLPSEVAECLGDVLPNLFNLVDEFWDGEAKSFGLDLEDDILKSCVITHDGAIVNETIKNLGGDQFMEAVFLSFILMLSIFLGFELISRCRPRCIPRSCPVRMRFLASRCSGRSSLPVPTIARWPPGRARRILCRH